MKKILSLITVLALLSIFCLPVFAAEKPLLVDESNLLSSEEFSSLESILNSYSDELGFDIVVLTVGSLDGKSSMEYADDYYDYNGYGQGENHDGCILLLSMEERDWWLSTTGYGITNVFTDEANVLNNPDVEAVFVPPFAYMPVKADGFVEFANFAKDCVNQARYGMPYDTNNLIDGYNNGGVDEYSTTEGRIKNGVISFIIAAVISLVITLITRSGYLKAVKFNANANNYLVPGSMHLTKSYDNFLYSNTTRVRIQSESSSSGGGSSTHTSSSGTSHGGGGGKF